MKSRLNSIFFVLSKRQYKEHTFQLLYLYLSFMNIRPWYWCWGRWQRLIELSVVFFLLGVVIEYPLLISSHNPMQKTFSLLSLNQLFASEKSPFNVSQFQFIKHPISLFLNYSYDSQSYRNGLLNYPQWFCKLLRLTLDLLRVMSLILCLRIFFGCPERGLFSMLKSPSLKTSKPFPWFISWSSITMNFDKHSMSFSRIFLPIKAENQNFLLLG